MEANNWINEVLKSTNGISKATPNQELFSKIQNKINVQNTVSNQWIWIAAASFAVLVSLNIKFIISNSNKTEVPTETIISSVSNNNQLY
ncbi:MAG: hypothetical protein RL308_1527 [Bacteroidota bacterium]|jgi:hypothetical protein